MRKVIITAVLSIIIGVGAGWFMFQPSNEGSTSSERKILYYRDPMNPQITSPTPKKASDGMDFVPVYDESSGTSGERKIAYYKDPMHPWFTSDKPGKAPDCGMDLVPVYEGESDTKGIKIDPVTVQNIGVKTETAEKRKLSKVIRAVGKIEFDETKVYSVNSKIMGWVEKLFVDYTGKLIRKGDPLMELYSPELVSTQEEYLQAIRYRQQMQHSSLEEARRGADALVESAKRRLLYWDVTEADIQELEKRGAPRKTMTFYSPVTGIVMDKMIFQGKSVMAGMELYKIADLSTVWVIADIYQYELPWVKVGQQTEIELSYLPARTFRGTITYIYPMLSMETKTARARIEVRNTPNIDLKPGMYATVKLISPIVVGAVAVPDQAIIRSGERNIVVIALGGGYFDPREVKLGVMAHGYVQILEGVKEGEKIVTSSQFLIDSESNLKAAVGLMLGHAGHDMSTGTKREQPEQQVQQPSEHEGHDTPSGQNATSGETMESAPKKGEHSAHETKQPIEVKNVVDPVCGMEITPNEEQSYLYKGKKYYFCSVEDMEKFKNDPEKYVKPEHQH
ncbi:MAG: efflux RND transporter periplasmic adaptor subunit [Bacteroidota bacterium]